MDRIILAIDLAWRNSGYVILSPDRGELLRQHKTLTTVKVEDDLYKTSDLIYDHFFNLMLQLSGGCLVKTYELHVVYEYTDWHQSLTGEGDEAKYARERNAQKYLAWAEAILNVAASHVPLARPPVRYGTMQVKNALGETSKAGIQKLLALEYPQLFWYDNGKIHARDGQPMTEHEADAMALAAVYERESYVQQLIAKSEGRG